MSILTSENCCTVRLVVESHWDSPHAVLPAILELPEAPAYLHLPADAAPFMTSAPPVSSDRCLILEPIHQPKRQPRVLLLSPEPGRVLLNDRRAGRVALLAERDQFRVGASPLFHVTLFTRPRIGPPPAELVGMECAICRVPFSPQTTCYRCSCGAALHSEGVEPDDTLLQCVRVVGECPRCALPIVLTEGYSWFPAEVSRV